MTEQQIHKKEEKKKKKLFSSVFNGAVTHKLIAYESENSLLFYNNLPLK